MTFLEELQAHRGGLLRIKSELYWYGGRGWDGARGRVCLLLDATATSTSGPRPSSVTVGVVDGEPHAVLLLIDGAPHWIWVANEDVELIT